ncbi:MAG: GPR endopeptidase, partial [Oscillospiraceae bacterium]|nr:GPR endopeptidase [Oscillospiraceae bacterium]
DITPDAVGPCTLDHVLATRHLKAQLPEDFAAFRPVSALCTGVLGTTGIESGDLVRSVCDALRPDCVIAVDALASRSAARLCRTVQLSDTGIVPGSGVGNARLALDRETLGVRVLSLGFPTVVDAATLTLDLAGQAGASLSPEDFGPLGGLIVTPRDIDRNVRDMGRLLGYGLNLALHPGLSVEDVDLLTG